MKLNKIIFFKESELLEACKEKYSLSIIYEQYDFSVYKGKRNMLEEENLIFVNYTDFSTSFDYIIENYDPFKIITSGFAEINENIDLKPGDVILPNTYVSNETEAPIFLNYAVGQDYDLEKFGLILSGVCFSGYFDENQEEVEDGFTSDVRDEDSYSNLQELQKNQLLDKSVVILGIKGDDDSVNNIVNIIDFIL